MAVWVSAEPEQRALVGPGEWQVDVLQGARGERGRLPPLDDGGDDIRREAADCCELAEPIVFDAKVAPDEFVVLQPTVKLIVTLSVSTDDQ